jgi:hypothetical protein
MFLEIILVMILIFLIIIASQNYARGGMQDENFNIIIFKLREINDRFLPKKKEPDNHTKITNKTINKYRIKQQP